MLAIKENIVQKGVSGSKELEKGQDSVPHKEKPRSFELGTQVICWASGDALGNGSELSETE